MSQQPFSNDQLNQFHQDSFIVVENLLDNDEVALLQKASKGDNVLMQNAHDVKDTSGRNSKLALWDHPRDDIYGMISRSYKVVDRVEQLIGTEGLSLSFNNDAQRAQSRRCLGVASGLWLLVPLWLSVSGYRCRDDRYR